MARTVEKALASAVATETVVICKVCGKRHRLDSDQFIVIYGDVRKGLEAPLIGGNINEKGQVIGSTVMCTEHEEVLGFLGLLEGIDK